MNKVLMYPKQGKSNDFLLKLCQITTWAYQQWLCGVPVLWKKIGPGEAKKLFTLNQYYWSELRSFIK